MSKMRKAQSLIEYAVLFVIVAMAVGGMKMYLLRSVKAQFKVLQDQVGGQYGNDTDSASQIAKDNKPH